MNVEMSVVIILDYASINLKQSHSDVQLSAVYFTLSVASVKEHLQTLLNPDGFKTKHAFVRKLIY